jgi:uncharacterized UPF0160 family protein
MTKTRIVTHSAGFHADDVFGVATLLLLLGEENCEVLRSREQSVIDSGEYVLDVGFVYDPDTNHFDHHQEGGAGKRENGVPYASFGLIWKKFGEKICGSAEAAHDIDVRLVQPVDAFDTGVDVYTPTIPGVYPYPISVAMFPFSSKGGGQTDFYDEFLETVTWAKTLLSKEVAFAQYRSRVFAIARAEYVASADKKIVVLSEPDLARELIQEAFQEYPEVIYFVHSRVDGAWQTVCGVNDVHFYKNRKDLPAAWAGKHHDELAEITGVPDAFFCHNGRFMMVAKSKEGAIKLAELALAS